MKNYFIRLKNLTSNKEIYNSAWLISERIFTLLMNLAVVTLIARYLGPKDYGSLNYLLSIIAIITPLTALGLNSIITKEVLTRPNAENTIIGSSITLRFLGGISVLILSVVVLTFFPSIHFKSYQLLLLLLCNLFTAFYVVDFYMQARSNNKVIAKLKMQINILLNIVKVAALLFEASLDTFIIIFGLEFVFLGTAMYRAYLLSSNHASKLRVSINECKYLISNSIWLLMSGVAAIIYLKIDQVMLGILKGEYAVGIYAVASKLSEVWYFLPVAIVTAFFPKLIKLQSTPHYYIHLQKLNDALFLIAFMIAFLVTIFAYPVINSLFGAEYNQSAYILCIHIWASLFIFMRALLSKWLLSENLLKFSLVSQASGAILNIVLNWFLIPQYEGVGAAVSTVISYATASFFILFVTKKTNKFALIMLKSMALPFRVLIYRKNLYRD